MQFLRLVLLFVLVVAAIPARAEPGWYVKPYGGFSRLADTSGDRIDAGASQSVDVDLSGGFLAGVGVGYRYGEHWVAEIAWEYRTNDSEILFADGTLYDDGNYASSVFYLNSYYQFASSGRWQPYIGAGVGWVQEIDIDLEGLGPEQSFSGDGDVALQVMGGVNYEIDDRWLIGGEIRYSKISEVDLDAESNAFGSIEGLDYDPWSVSLGVTYRF